MLGLGGGMARGWGAEGHGHTSEWNEGPGGMLDGQGEGGAGPDDA